MEELMCQICGEQSVYAYIYTNPQMDERDTSDEIAEGDGQYACKDCADDLIERGIAREIPLDHRIGNATTHVDTRITYISSGDEETWISSDAGKNVTDNR